MFPLEAEKRKKEGAVMTDCEGSLWLKMSGQIWHMEDQTKENKENLCRTV